MPERMFAPGFRVTRHDGLILAAGLAAVALLAPARGRLALIVAMAVGHFFLFCNVFRIRRLPELVWAAVFIVCGGLVQGEVLGWPVAVVAWEAVAAVLIGLEMRDPSYHGIGWRWINPGLPPWWRERNGGE